MDIDKILNYYNLELDAQNKVLCPFHEDTIASMDIDFDKEIFYCFGCNASGNIMTLVAKLENCNELEATQKISKILNGEVSTKRKIIISISKKEALEKAWQEWQKADKPDWNFKNYLTKRGLSPEILDKFEVRFDGTSDYKFIIPLRENGIFKGYVKRCLDNRPNKYLYNKGFKRKFALVGEFGYGVIIVTEGILDYLKAYQYGARNICCILGWKASFSHIRKLRRFTNNLIIGLDNDNKGEEGIQWLENYFNVGKLLFPNGIKDICEMSKKQFNKSMKGIKWQSK